MVSNVVTQTIATSGILFDNTAQHSGDGDGDANCYVHVHCTGLRKPPRQPAAVLRSVLRTRNITEMDPTPHCLHSLHY